MSKQNETPRVEVRQKTPTPPPVEVVITLSPEEAERMRRLYGALFVRDGNKIVTSDVFSHELADGIRDDAYRIYAALSSALPFSR